MRSWLYDPKNDYKGRIFEDEDEIAQAKADGWEEAPYSSFLVAEIVFTEKRKPGRKPNALKAGKK